MRVLWTLMMVAVSLAGCSGAEAPAPVLATCQEVDCEAVVADEGPEIFDIRGVVVDETITPIAGATVLLQRPGGEILAEVLSNDVGAFTFRGVEPTFYQLVASAEHHISSNTQIEVTPNMHTVRLMLTADPLATPYHLLLTFDGLMGCSAKTVGRLQLCSILDDVDDEMFGDASVVSFWEPLNAAGRHADFLQTEMIWESTQALGAGLTMMIDANVENSWYGRDLATVEGASPLIHTVDNGTIEEYDIGASAPGDTSRGIGIQVWSGQDEYPVGATYQQDFQIFFTATYDFTPASGWTFVREGAPT